MAPGWHCNLALTKESFLYTAAENTRTISFDSREIGRSKTVPPWWNGAASTAEMVVRPWYTLILMPRLKKLHVNRPGQRLDLTARGLRG